MQKLLLFDGYSILSRAFFGIPELINSEGIHTNAIYGFLTTMFKLLEEENPTHIAVAFDVNKKTFRHLAYSEYKGTRKSLPDELISQVPILKDLLKAMNIAIFSKEGYEADDILGTIAKKVEADNMEVAIVSGDRDLLQLASKKIKIKITKPGRNSTNIKDYYEDDFLNEYKITPVEYIDVKALMGDVSDNIKGVKGIGEKTAIKLIQEFKSIENAFENSSLIKPERIKNLFVSSYEDAVFSKFLSTIKTDAEISFNLEEMKVRDVKNQKSFEIISRLEFTSLMKKFQNENIDTSIKLDYEYEIIKDKEDALRVLDEIKEVKELAFLPVYIYEDSKDSEIKKEYIHAFLLSYTKKTILINLAHEDNIELIRKLFVNKNKIYTLDLKNIIKYIDIEYREKYQDLALMSYLINPIQAEYDVYFLAKSYLNVNFISRKDLVGKIEYYKDFIKNIESENEKFIKYILDEATLLFILIDKIEAKLKELSLNELYEKLELPLTYLLAKMEIEGIKIDTEFLKTYSKELEEKASIYENKIYELANEKFNINSPKQLGEILFVKLKLEGGKKTKTGYSTAVEILESLENKYEVIKYILLYRQITKLNSTFAQGLLKYVGSDGRIHTKFNQIKAATGRLSSTEPNLQNIPIKTDLGIKLRGAFVSKEGYSFVDADYSQIELRVLAHLSADEKLIESYKKGKDIHKITASNVFNIALDKVSDLERRMAKAVNFGVVYGMSAFSLSKDLNISRQEALEYINNYFSTYKEVKTFLNSQIKEAQNTGYTKTILGRIRQIPELKNSNFNIKSLGERIAMNSPIQGSAADIIKLAMLSLDENLKKSGFDAKIILQIHDELLLEVADKDVLEVKKIVEKSMKEAISLKVALEVEAKSGKNWLEAK